MQAPPPQVPPTNPYFLPALAAGTYGAAVIAVFGFIALIFSLNVLKEPGASVLLAPAMVAAAIIVTFRRLVRVQAELSPWRDVAGAVASAYVVMLLIGGVGYAIGVGQLLWVPLFIAGEALSPFMLSAALLSGVHVLGLWALTTREANSR
ncbi:MAG TPA: DUF6121 family protein [Glaciihabitans sp.]|jgi:hypothetical protein|nr:DUF6121 family protein [Glaciihabitans sp.]